jgi:hypothetical protein
MPPITVDKPPAGSTPLGFTLPRHRSTDPEG